MKIVNTTKKTTLTTEAFAASSSLEKSLGLLDPRKPRSLILHTRFGIHTFAMKEAIDVLILDADATVVTMKQNLKPNRLFLWHPKFSTVIELPTGTIKKSQTKPGDVIQYRE